MSIVQISRIQQRRGKKNSGTGLPQLASGELAWCVDSQELYIGNGSVAEGSPTVGNTKIITEKDLSNSSNLLSLCQYVYKVDDPSIQTGVDANFPISRPIQHKLDEQISIYDFISSSDISSGDFTIAFQRAIDQLFLNTSHPAHSTESSRNTLLIPAGFYPISGTLFIPSFASILGEGKDKTIISHSGNSSVFRFVNDLSTPGNPAGISGIQYTNQPRFITISGLSLRTNAPDQAVLYLESVRDSVFTNIKIQSNYVNSVKLTATHVSNNILTVSSTVGLSAGMAIFFDSSIAGITANRIYYINSAGFTDTSIQISLTPGGSGSPVLVADTTGLDIYVYPNGAGIKMKSMSSLVTCERNLFENIYIQNITFAIMSSHDILSNVFNDGYIFNATRGFVFGLGSDGTSIGMQYGPRDININNFKFSNIKQHAIYTELSSNIFVNHISLFDVGNNGGGVYHPKFPQVYFDNPGNSCFNISSDRSDVLTNIAAQSSYIGELCGHGYVQSNNNRILNISNHASFTPLFRLPLNSSAYGVPSGSVIYTIEYHYKSLNDFSRSGVLSITYDITHNHVQVCDEYNYAGSGSTEIALMLEFGISMLNADNTTWNGTQLPYTLLLSYKNTLSSDTGTFHYTYKAVL